MWNTTSYYVVIEMFEKSWEIIKKIIIVVFSRNRGKQRTKIEKIKIDTISFFPEIKKKFNIFHKLMKKTKLKINFLIGKKQKKVFW